MVISPLNYPGNKAKLLKEIIPLLPINIDVFYDVFGGSGIVSVNSSAKKIIFNDLSKEAFALFKYFVETPTEKIIENMEMLISKYGLTYSRIKPKDTYKEYNHEGLSLYNKNGFAQTQIIIVKLPTN
ncbi:MAG: DNA adenine methylase [Christensenellaceae bacterium]|jgi:site-specific DNA-adenine methylase|nr:DNA adenine methylase [Christensenellaceae bacterium]